MSTKLYVGNLLYELTDDQLRDLFAQAGTVVSAAVIRYHDSGRSKGFGFVEMSTPEEAQAAIDMFNNQDHQGRRLVVAEARPPKPREEGGDRRRGGGRGDHRGSRRDDRGNDDAQQPEEQPAMADDAAEEAPVVEEAPAAAPAAPADDTVDMSDIDVTGGYEEEKQ
jgi:RNA recognition motif-containing protein